MAGREIDAQQLASTVAELGSVSDWLQRQRDRVAAMAERFVGTDREDVLTTLHEAERQLDLAARAVERATRSADIG